MSEDQSLLDKIKQLIGGGPEIVRDVEQTFTGKAIEDKVDEYSKVYTQVLLGMHRDMQAQDKRLAELAAEVESLRRRIPSGRNWALLAVVSLALSLAAVVVAVLAIVLK